MAVRTSSTKEGEGTTSLDRKSVDEKVENVEIPGDSSVDFRHGDEALKLIDAENAVKFSEEYNLRLRRKLVCPIFSKES